MRSFVIIALLSGLAFSTSWAQPAQTAENPAPVPSAQPASPQAKSKIQNTTLKVEARVAPVSESKTGSGKATLQITPPPANSPKTSVPTPPPQGKVTKDEQDSLAPMMVRSMNYVLVVGSRESAVQKVRALADSQYGYMLSLNNHSIQLKIPQHNFLAFCDSVEKLGIVMQKEGSSFDNRDQFIRLKMEIENKYALLADYFEILDATQQVNTLQSVEREVMQITNELERLTGQMRKLVHRAQFSNVSISFQFHDRRAPVRQGKSVFPWINNLDLRNLMEDFQ